MKQAEFMRAHEARWREFEASVANVEKRKRIDGAEAHEFAARYRELCQHLSLARARGYGRELCSYLHALSLRGHRSLHARRPWLDRRVADLVIHAYPRLVRRHWRPIAISAAAFFGTMLVMFIGTQINDELIYRIISPEQLVEFEAMYPPGSASDTSSRVGPEREASSDFLAFAFYLSNNTGIGFQTFAGGLLLCIGSLFFLLFNGLYIGAIAGHLTANGSGVPFWSFVAGHSAFELSAIALSGGAGLRLGWALIAPGNFSRKRALREGARSGVRIMLGAALLFFLAAIIEGFWSAIGATPPLVKYVVGVAFWALTLGWLALGGRGDDLAEQRSDSP